jgi:hypothetical protein
MQARFAKKFLFAKKKLIENTLDDKLHLHVWYDSAL